MIERNIYCMQKVLLEFHVDVTTSLQGAHHCQETPLTVCILSFWEDYLIPFLQTSQTPVVSADGFGSCFSEKIDICPEGNPHLPSTTSTRFWGSGGYSSLVSLQLVIVEQLFISSSPPATASVPLCWAPPHLLHRDHAPSTPPPPPAPPSSGTLFLLEHPC